MINFKKRKNKRKREPKVNRDQAKRLETFAQHTQSYTKYYNTKQMETYEHSHEMIPPQWKQFLHCFFVACFSFFKWLTKNKENKNDFRL